MAIALLVSGIPAYGSTRSDKVARARAVKGRIDQLRTQAEIAAESYDAARQKHSDLLGQLRADQARVRRTKKRIGTLQVHLNTRASDMYRGGAVTFLDVLLGAKDFSEFSSNWDFLSNLNTSDASRVSDLKVAKQEYLAAQRDMTAREKSAAQQVSVMKSRRAQVTANLAQQNSLLTGIQAQIAALDAAAAARAARQNGVGSWVSNTFGHHYPHPTIPANASVVELARSRIGCPYVWGAAGPNAFDCSGLALWCYANAKPSVGLPHSSAAQIGVGQRVNKSDLQPGDLVFFGSPIHHVGIYVGGGEMIEAPHSGAVVRYASAFRSDYAGACRP